MPVKAIGLALLAVGVVLLIFGLSASDSSDHRSRDFFTGDPTDKAIWLLLGATAALVLGGFLIIRAGSARRRVKHASARSCKKMPTRRTVEGRERKGKERIMKLQSLRDLYLDQLRDLFSAEQQIVEALPKIVKSASSRELQEAIQNHYEETGEHVTRLSKILEKLGEPTGGKTCQGMKGLLREGSEYIESKNEIAAPVLDAGLIAAAQRVEHYEISAYGTARTFADLLGEHEAAQLLAQYARGRGASRAT
jgi:ferritin-like metal-binding protein YciE